MTQPAIRVEGLWKEYVVGTRATAGDTFYDMLSGLLRRPFGGRAGFDEAAARADRFWALRDVSFEVQPGEVVGIIGRNGAGKSTLLKILSRITAPTKGRVEVRGRLASLLEVGTGFHPELTGRENIFLNGAILGMTRREIARKFDEIVAFAEVEKFIDTPVKRYSSGMYVRLAFAVAAHLEPDLLVIDEVLAVGDAEFRRRCIRRMQDIAREGIAVILVSHSMQDVLAFCPRVLVLKQGRVLHDGEREAGVAAYQQQGAANNDSSAGLLIGQVDVRQKPQPANLGAAIVEVVVSVAPVSGSWKLRIGFYDARGAQCAVIDSPVHGPSRHHCCVTASLHDIPFVDGVYTLNVAVVSEGGRPLEVREACARVILSSGRTSNLGPPVWVPCEWLSRLAENS